MSAPRFARLVRIAWLLLFPSLGLACANSLDARCQRLCEQAAECAEQNATPEFRMDVNECTAACDSLLRNDEGKLLVDRYEQCAGGEISTCEVILRCQGSF